ncbi:NifU family protein [Magnetovibrio sp. PR-2]|uniref:NifU family protein n=1 Tax=Magnetovibrio sp. PR-2 TaxID=3120356 RepID=UPI002FCE17B1
MFIQTEATPNPATLKFLPGQAVMASGTANFTDAESAAKSPLAVTLFGIDGVDGIFLGADFVTVTKTDAVDWDVVKPRVLAAVMDHFTQGLPVMEDAGEAADDGAEDSDTVKQIKELIETRVRPAVAQDGGDIVFRSFEEGVVYLHMQGACAGCPSSTATLKNGIENMLRHFVPEVTEVRAVN